MPEFTEYAPGAPRWVDVTSPELDRTISFYVELFGWESEQDSRPEAGGYAMFSKDGKLVAGATPPQQEGMPSSWATYLATDDVDATVGRIREAGGSLLLEPLDVFADGRMAVAQDPTGAAFSIWQAGEHHGAQLANEPGSLAWNECQTNDAETAAAFYCAVFGYEVEAVPMGEGEPYRVLKLGEKSVAGIFELNDELRGAPASWATVFAVADADEAVARAQELGGTVLVPPLDIPDVGRFAALQDPVGAVFQVLADPAS
ncbi:MAG: VOC family protein [Actinomycetota bacterium]|nr:VOC family protein [Actinomycetota bacterium]